MKLIMFIAIVLIASMSVSHFMGKGQKLSFDDSSGEAIVQAQNSAKQKTAGASGAVQKELSTIQKSEGFKAVKDMISERNYDGAISYLNRAIKKNESVHLYLARSLVHKLNGDDLHAKLDVNKAKDLSPDVAKKVEELFEAGGSSFQTSGQPRRSWE